MRFGADSGSQGRGWWGRRGWPHRPGSCGRSCEAGAARRGVSAAGRGPPRFRTRLLQPQNMRDLFFKSPTSESWKRVPTSPGRGESDGKEGRRFLSECQPAQAMPHVRAAPCSYAASRRPGPSSSRPEGTCSEALLRKTTSPPQNQNFQREGWAEVYAKAAPARVLRDRQCALKCTVPRSPDLRHPNLAPSKVSAQRTVCGVGWTEDVLGGREVLT